jgi:hypothetical protein
MTDRCEPPLARVAHYVAMRDAAPLRQVGDSVHGIHTGTQWEAELRLSDLRVVVAEIARLREALTEIAQPLDSRDLPALRGEPVSWRREIARAALAKERKA